MASTLPSTHRAMVLESIDKGFKIQEVDTPRPTPGAAVVKILAANVLSYHGDIYNGKRQYAFPTPLTGGYSAVGRVAAVAPDATTVQPGQLVYVDCVIRARDDPSAIFLSALHEGSSAGSKKLMRDVWRNGAFAEYARFPLENCIPLDEDKLRRQLGYSIPDLQYMSTLLVPFGGLRDVGVEPGETVLVAPATGNFGGAGVAVAAAMGARVIAMGRNESELARVKAIVESNMPGSCVEIARITSDEALDTAALQALGPIDAVLDLSPPQASSSSHMRSALKALRYEGRVSLMGFADVTSDPAVKWRIIGANISFKGKLMYTRQDMLQFVRMMERGLIFGKGGHLADTKIFPLEKIGEAFEVAAAHTGVGRSVVIVP